MVVLLSSFDLSQHFRSAGLTLDNSKWGLFTGSLPIEALLTFLFSYAAAVSDLAFWKEDFSLLNCYMGLFTLIMIVVSFFYKGSRKSMVSFLIIGLMLLSFALATVFPFRLWLTFLPFMSLFRFSTLFRIFAIFFLLLASGYGFDSVFKKQISVKPFRLIILIACMLFLSLEIVLFFEIENWKFKELILKGVVAFNQVSTLEERIFFQARIQLGLLTIMLVSLSIKQKEWWKMVLVAVAISDMVISAQLNNYSTVFNEYNPSPVNQKLHEMPLAFPIPSLRTDMNTIDDPMFQSKTPYLWKNLSMFYKIPSSGGVSPYAYDFYSDAIKNGNYDAIIRNPLLFICDSILPNGNIDSLAIFKGSYNCISITSFNPNEISCTVNNLKSQKYLVFLQNDYPYWKASVNNSNASITKVNGTFMAIPLLKGMQSVRFIFSPKKIIYAAYLNIIGLIFIAACVVYLVYVNYLKRGSPLFRSSLIFAFCLILFFAGKNYFYRRAYVRSLTDISSNGNAGPEYLKANEKGN